MNLQKIIKIVTILVGLISLFFLVKIVGAGDEEIEASADIQSGIVDPFIYVAYIVLGVIVALVVLFSFKQMFTNAQTLKKTLTNVGAFLILALICYFGFANGVETTLKDGGTLSADGSKLLGAGLYLFYALILAAGGLMLFFGIKKMIK